MKPDYKKLTKGLKAFKKDYPNGTVFKASSLGSKMSIEDKSAFDVLFNSVLSEEGAKRYLRLLQEYPKIVSPDRVQFAKDVFNSILRGGHFDDPYALRNIGKDLTHPLLSNGHWAGEGFELLRFLCENTAHTSKTIKSILSASGFDYTLRSIQQVKKPTKKK